jgi:methionyl-tRNA formyltransferase
MKNKIICIAGKNKIAVECHKYILNNFPLLKTIACINRNDLGLNDWQPSYLFFCNKNKIPVYNLEDCYQIDNIVFFSLEFDRLIKTEKFISEQLYNIHFSLLPKYKGMYTSAIPILNGDEESGVTLHHIDNGIDTGDIIDQKKFEISLWDNAETLYKKYIETSIELFKSNFERILNQNFNSYPQNSIYSTYYSKAYIDYEKEIKIDLNSTAFQIHNQLRAFNFRRYQLPLVHGYKIHRSEISTLRCTGKPGTIEYEDDFKLTLNTIDYFIDVYKDKLKEIFLAAESGDILALRMYSSNGYNLNEKNQFGWDILIVACFYEHIELVEYILKNDICSVNSVNSNGTTALMYSMTSASKSSRTDILSLLLSFGADLKLCDEKGKNIFDYASEYNNSIIISYLNDYNDTIFKS